MFDPSLLFALTAPSSIYQRPVPQQDLSVAATLAGEVNQGSAVRYDRRIVDQVLDDLDRTTFEQLVTDWVADTFYDSSLKIITNHPSFVELVRMGEPAVRLILQAMERGDVKVHWFPVLKDVTGHDPVAHQDRGFTRRMGQAWVAWGKNTGRI